MAKTGFKNTLAASESQAQAGSVPVNGIGIDRKKMPFYMKAGIVLCIFAVLAAGVLITLFLAGLSPPIPLKPSGLAIIPLKGDITNQSGGAFGSLTADDVVAMIDAAEKNPQVAAILLDIDSGGGEIIASKQIAYRVRESKKPVYSYIGSVGASGAYYVAAATSHIMADRDSITGSIGVISTVPNLEGLLEKIGVKMNVLKEGNLKDIGSPYREMTEQDRNVFQRVLLQAFENFKADVLSFRNGKLTKQRLDEIADGRIMTGQDALQNNLVDELAPTRKIAIQRAGELSGINAPYEIQYGAREFTIYDLLFSAGESFGSGFVESIKASARADSAALQVK